MIGLLPTREEYGRFMADKSPDKRAKLVDELLGRKEFVEMWVMKWAELLQIRTNVNDQLQVDPAYYNWLQSRSPATCRSTRSCRSCSSPRAARSRTRPTNYYQNETDP